MARNSVPILLGVMDMLEALDSTPAAKDYVTHAHFLLLVFSLRLRVVSLRACV